MLSSAFERVGDTIRDLIEPAVDGKYVECYFVLPWRVFLLFIYCCLRALNPKSYGRVFFLFYISHINRTPPQYRITVPPNNSYNFKVYINAGRM